MHDSRALAGEVAGILPLHAQVAADQGHDGAGEQPSVGRWQRGAWDGGQHQHPSQRLALQIGRGTGPPRSLACNV